MCSEFWEMLVFRIDSENVYTIFLHLRKFASNTQRLNIQMNMRWHGVEVRNSFVRGMVMDNSGKHNYCPENGKSM